MGDLVSVIIPAYNASGFILETVKSILDQSHTEIELIIVNDGSTDNTLELLNSISDSRVKIHDRANHGVSPSRNFGLKKANGTYVIFFDSDDLMPPDFIKARLKFLQENPFFSFVTSWVQRINQNGELIGELLKSACNDLQNEILLYHADIITCPSGYLFKKQDLITNNLFFEEHLSSAADRYFLLKIDKFIKGHFLRVESIPLYYRIRTESMSNKLNEGLIKDNELFYDLVLNEIKPKPRIRKLFLSKSNYILFGAYFKVGKYGLSLKHAFISLMIDPVNFIKTMFKKNPDTYYFQ